MNAKDFFTSSGLNIIGTMKIENLPLDLKQSLSGFSDQFHKDDMICLIGAGGTELWKKISKEEKAKVDFIDNYSLKMLQDFDPDALILYPREHFNFPLQRLGRLLNLCAPSSLGLDLHPEFGPWFAFRCAFITRKKMSPEEGFPFLSACSICKEQNCRKNCPAEATQLLAFEVKKCQAERLLNHLCQDSCLARISCPEGKGHAYTQEQLSYHMLQSKRWLK